MAEIKTVSVKCPTCNKDVLMIESSTHRPFCSQRCRDIDFGDWASERYRVAGNPVESDSWSEELNTQE